MDLDRPFTTVTPTVDGDVLSVLAWARHSFTPPEVHRVLGERSESGVRNALDRLAAQGVVERVRVGRAHTYRLREDHLAHDHIVAIARLKDELIRRLRQELGELDPSPPYAALFGSAAVGAMSPESDLDIFIVRPEGIAFDDERWREQIDALESKASRWTGNDARTFELSSSEVADATARGDDRVLRDIRSQGIRLVGPVTYLFDLAKAGR